MPISSTNTDGYVTVSSATQSDYLSLNPGFEWMLSFTSAGAFALDLQVQAGDGSTWDDVYDGTNTQVTIDSTSGIQNVVVRGGANYRMDVTTYNNPITMWARQC